jgi:hypothetical protein
VPENVVARPRRLPRPHAPSPQGIETSVTDSAVVTVRNLRHFWRQPDLLVFSTIQPIMFVILFVYVFGGAVGLALPPGVTYVDYLLPGSSSSRLRSAHPTRRSAYPRTCAAASSTASVRCRWHDRRCWSGERRRTSCETS